MPAVRRPPAAAVGQLRCSCRGSSRAMGTAASSCRRRGPRSAQQPSAWAAGCPSMPASFPAGHPTAEPYRRGPSARSRRPSGSRSPALRPSAGGRRQAGQSCEAGPPAAAAALRLAAAHQRTRAGRTIRLSGAICCRGVSLACSSRGRSTAACRMLTAGPLREW